jgi:hypothetical protein
MHGMTIDALASHLGIAAFRQQTNRAEQHGCHGNRHLPYGKNTSCCLGCVTHCSPSIFPRFHELTQPIRPLPPSCSPSPLSNLLNKKTPLYIQYAIINWSSISTGRQFKIINVKTGEQSLNRTRIKKTKSKYRATREHQENNKTPAAGNPRRSSKKEDMLELFIFFQLPGKRNLPLETSGWWPVSVGRTIRNWILDQAKGFSNS